MAESKIDYLFGFPHALLLFFLSVANFDILSRLVNQGR
jgi:hypothetical protein